MYKLNEEKMFYDVADGIAVIIDFTTGVYYGMDALSSAVFDALMDGASDDAVINALKQLPGCPADAENQYKAFVQKLLDREMILGDGTGGECAPFDESLIAYGFQLNCEDFSEVRDLLMADPIHDVEPEMGWPFLKDE